MLVMKIIAQYFLGLNAKHDKLPCYRLFTPPPDAFSREPKSEQRKSNTLPVML